MAEVFSFEQPTEGCTRHVGTTFGFHGKLTLETRHLCDCLYRLANGGKLRLVVNYYNDPHYPRAVEIDECLRANCGPGLFDEVVVPMSAYGRVPNYRRLRRCWYEGRPTFADHFEAVESGTQKADVNVIANADIEFTPEACQLLRRVPCGEFWCLSRWEGGSEDRPWAVPTESYACCQDVWAWRGACRIDQDAARFPLGYPGCENRLAYLAREKGYRVANPSLSVEMRHVHQSGFRRYPATDFAVKCPDRVPPPYAYVKPHKIGETPEVTIDAAGPNLPEKENHEELALHS